VHFDPNQRRVEASRRAAENDAHFLVNIHTRSVPRDRYALTRDLAHP
jgi:hypothetical protein